MRCSSLVFVLLVCQAALLAQKWEISPTVARVRPGRGDLGSLPENENPGDRDTRLRDGTGVGARFTWNTEGYYGLEGAFLRAKLPITARVTPLETGGPTQRDGKINTDFGSFNILAYFMPAGERWRPFITVGGQAIQYGDPGFAEWSRGKSRHYGANFGGGIKLMIVKNLLVRFDLRDYVGGKPWDLSYADQTRLSGGLLHNIEGSFGISIAF